MIHIDSDCGRIGELWWVNSNTIPIPLEQAWSGFHLFGFGIRWGSIGFGPDITIHYEPVELAG